MGQGLGLTRSPGGLGGGWVKQKDADGHVTMYTHTHAYIYIYTHIHTNTYTARRELGHQSTSERPLTGRRGDT